MRDVAVVDLNNMLDLLLLPLAVLFTSCGIAIAPIRKRDWLRSQLR